MELENTTAPVDKSPEKDSDDDESSTKKKRAGRVARRLAESQSEGRDKSREKSDDKPRTPWEFFKNQPKEVKTASKEDVPQEDEVAKDEKQMATSALAEEEARAIPEHSPDEAVSEKVAEEVSAKVFLEKVAETGDVDAAVAETLEELQATPAEAEAVMVAAATPEDVPAQTGEADESGPENTEEIVFDRAAESEPDEARETDEETPQAGTASPSPPPPATVAGGGAGQPPLGPRPTFQPGAYPPQGGPGAIPSLSGNLYNTPVTPSSPAVERYDQGNPAVTALIGGIIGYMIGRRRGRIRAEKRLVPIQKKLERQVEDLHWEIKAKEKAIRRVAAEKVRNDGVLVIKSVANNRQARQQEKPPIINRAENASRRPAPEAGQLHGTKAREHLGRVLLTAESTGLKRDKQPEKARLAKQESKQVERIPEHLRRRSAETLNRADLLAISDKIIIDGTTLRQIYETHLIGERGLRRLVAEYMRGGDVKKILRQEIIEHEIDFERDPVMRDLPATTAPSSSPTTATSHSKTLEKLVEQASAGFGTETDALAYYKARAVYEAQEKDEDSGRPRLIDIGFGVAIAVLLAIIIVLFLTRG